MNARVHARNTTPRDCCFGNAAASDPAYYFVYDGDTFALKDSIAVPIGPSGLVGATF